MNFTENEIKTMIAMSAAVIEKSSSLSKDILEAVKLIDKCFQSKNKILIFGNGGSAADAQHMAAEFIGRFQLERKAIPAIALTTDSSILTALPNDYDFDIVFSRQCEALVEKGDVAFGISTSGNSANVKNGLVVARQKGAKTISLLGKDGGSIKDVSDLSIIVQSDSTARIQEVHRTIIHIICELTEKSMTVCQ